jgi:hypothetical protein
MCGRWRRPRNSYSLFRQETLGLAVEHLVAMSTSGSYRESLTRHCPDEAFHLRLVVVAVDRWRGRARPNPRSDRSSAGAFGDRDTWTLMLVAARRSRVQPGASSSFRKVTIRHCSTPQHAPLLRHPREGGGPGASDEAFAMDSRFRGNDESKWLKPAPGRHRPDEAIHLGFVVVVVHAGADECR